MCVPPSCTCSNKEVGFPVTDGSDPDVSEVELNASLQRSACNATVTI